MAQAYQKYLFDRDFDAPESAAPAFAMVEEGAPLPEPEVVIPTFTVEELQAAREQGLKDGHEAALREAQASLQRMSALSLAAIAGGMREGAELFRSALDKRHSDGVLVAMAALRKLQPELVRRSGVDEVARVVEECVRQLDGQLKVTLRVNPGWLEHVQEGASAAAQRAGFEGKMTFSGDARLPLGNCRVEWDDGGAERDVGRIWTEIDAIIARSLGDDGHKLSFDGNQPPVPIGGVPQPPQVEGGAPVEAQEPAAPVLAPVLPPELVGSPD